MSEASFRTFATDDAPAEVDMSAWELLHFQPSPSSSLNWYMFLPFEYSDKTAVEQVFDAEVVRVTGDDACAAFVRQKSFSAPPRGVQDGQGIVSLVHRGMRYTFIQPKPIEGPIERFTLQVTRTPLAPSSSSRLSRAPSIEMLRALDLTKITSRNPSPERRPSTSANPATRLSIASHHSLPSGFNVPSSSSSRSQGPPLPRPPLGAAPSSSSSSLAGSSRSQVRPLPPPFPGAAHSSSSSSSQQQQQQQQQQQINPFAPQPPHPPPQRPPTASPAPVRPPPTTSSGLQLQMMRPRAERPDPATTTATGAAAAATTGLSPLGSDSPLARSTSSLLGAIQEHRSEGERSPSLEDLEAAARQEHGEPGSRSQEATPAELQWAQERVAEEARRRSDELSDDLSWARTSVEEAARRLSSESARLRDELEKESQLRRERVLLGEQSRDVDAEMAEREEAAGATGAAASAAAAASPAMGEGSSQTQSQSQSQSQTQTWRPLKPSPWDSQQSVPAPPTQRNFPRFYDVIHPRRKKAREQFEARLRAERAARAEEEAEARQRAVAEQASMAAGASRSKPLPPLPQPQPQPASWEAQAQAQAQAKAQGQGQGQSQAQAEASASQLRESAVHQSQSQWQARSQQARGQPYQQSQSQDAQNPWFGASQQSMFASASQASTVSRPGPSTPTRLDKGKQAEPSSWSQQFSASAATVSPPRPKGPRTAPRSPSRPLPESPMTPLSQLASWAAPQSFFSTPWKKWVPRRPDLSKAPPAIVAEYSDPVLSTHRDEMIAARTMEALHSATSDPGAKHFGPFANDAQREKAEAHLQARMQTPGGRMLKKDLTGVAFIVKQVVAMRAAINMQTSVDLDIFSRAFTAEEHAELFMRCMDNWAVPYVRTVKDATDLLAARPEADAHKCPSQGTYAWFLETSDAVGGPRAQVFYDGMTSEQTIAGRSKQHEDNFDEFKEALKSPEKYDIMTVRNKMPLLYGDFVHDKEALVMTRGPPGGEKAVAKWLIDAVRRIAPKSGHGLKDLGARWCEAEDDQYQYMVRQVTAFHELMGTALFNCVSNGFDLMHVLDGARFNDREVKGGNRYVPCVPFATLEGSRAWRHKRDDIKQTTNAAAIKRKQQLALRHGERLSLSASMLTRTRSQTQTQYSSALTEMESLIETLIAAPDDNEEANMQLELIYAMSQGEGHLNIDFNNVVDHVRYVEKLPEVAGSQPAWFEDGDEPTEWRVDVANRLVYRRIGTKADHRMRLWKKFNEGTFGGFMANGTLRVKPFRGAPETSVTVEGMPFEGFVKVKFVPRNLGGALIPRSASPEAAYLLSKYSIEIYSDVNGECFDWSPRAKDLDQGGWNGFLGPLGVELLVQYKDRVPYVKDTNPDVEHLRGVAACMRSTGSAFEVKADSRGAQYIELIGTPHHHAEWGTFAAVNDATRRVPIKVTPHPNGLAQDVIFFVDESRGEPGLYESLLYATRPRPTNAAELKAGWAPFKLQDKKAVTTDVIEEWVIFYLLNLARISRGFFPPEKLLRPSSRQSPKRPSVALPPDSKRARTGRSSQQTVGSSQQTVGSSQQSARPSQQQSSQFSASQSQRR